ncbi:unnamed protein product [Calypogeia fissa]
MFQIIVISVVNMLVMKGSTLHIAVVSLTLQLAIFILTWPDSLIVSADGTGVGAAGRGRVDVHAHFIPPFYQDIVLERNLTAGGTATPNWSAIQLVEEQAKFNVKTSVLSISVPGVSFFEPHEVAERRELARRVNEFGHNVSVEYPNRLEFFATLPLPDVEGAVDEAIHCLDVLKAAGVALFGNSNGVYLGNPDLDPLMEVLNDRNAVAFVHPNLLYQDEDETGIPGPVLDFLLDTSRVATNLVVRNVTGRYPKIKWILAHSGGFIPFAAGRISLMYSQNLPNTTREDLLQRLKIFNVEISFTDASQLPSVLDFFTAEKMLLGSDSPNADGLSFVTSSLDAFPLTVHQRDNINFGNAAALFGGSFSSKVGSHVD